MPGPIKTVIVESPNARRLRSFRIRGGIAALCVAIFLCGFAGYFIPFNRFTLNIIEQNQKHNLHEQNQLLGKRTRILHNQVRTLQEETEELAQKKQQLIKIIGNTTGGKSHERPARSRDAAAVPLDELVGRVMHHDSIVHSFMRKIIQDRRYIYKVPVLRPIPEKIAPISARFGKMRDPFTGSVKRHHGVDFACVRGTPVIVTASGTVTRVEKDKRWGHRVRVHHDFGFSTVYAHLGTVKVRRGKKVRRGEVIATVGLSGLTSGPHLHYEVRYHDKPVNPLNVLLPELAPAGTLADAPR